jgi:hypothetical protein
MHIRQSYCRSKPTRNFARPYCAITNMLSISHYKYNVLPIGGVLADFDWA